MKTNENEILTIAGERVRVVRGDGAIIDTDCSLCAFCRFDGNEYSCRFPNRKEPCAPYVTEDSYAYFVPAEESEPKNWPADKDNLVGKQAGESVDRWVVTNAFLHCDRAGKIVSEMYGDKFNNSRNRDKYLAFLQQVNLDDRFGELARILQRYGAMPAPKEQPETDFDELIKQEMVKVYETYTRPDYIEENTTEAAYDFDAHIARHFAEWERERMMKEQSHPQWKPSEVQLDALWAALGVTDYVAGSWIENGGERSIGMSKDELHERLISLYKDLKNL